MYIKIFESKLEQPSPKINMQLLLEIGALITFLHKISTTILSSYKKNIISFELIGNKLLFFICIEDDLLNFHHEELESIFIKKIVEISKTIEKINIGEIKNNNSAVSSKELETLNLIQYSLPKRKLGLIPEEITTTPLRTPDKIREIGLSYDKEIKQVTIKEAKIIKNTVDINILDYPGLYVDGINLIDKKLAMEIINYWESHYFIAEISFCRRGIIIQRELCRVISLKKGAPRLTQSEMDL